MRKYYLAADIGASSGRVILGSRNENGKFDTLEVHRFPNSAEERNGLLCWDYARIFGEIIIGMRKCREMGKVPVSMGVDTWGVDYVLQSADGQIVGETVAYRDGRTKGVPAEVAKIISDEELYKACGIQQLPINTIYQLWTERGKLHSADCLLMAPDYLNYLLTGKAANEYTIATTTALVSAEKRTWDSKLLEKLGYPQKLFGELCFPGETLGELKSDVAESVGFNCRVVLPGTHDTASAVAAAPLDDNSLYISSGTWSLLGVENTKPNTNEDSRLCNFTNEGGAYGTYRYLKNITGLWMIQETRRELGGHHSFEELSEMAEAKSDFPSIVDVNDDRYLAPESMIGEIQKECRETGQPIPETPGQLAHCVYFSLSESYAKAICNLSALTGCSFDRICIVGGGCQNTYLNNLTEQSTGLRVSAGPVEATAIGNIAVQMIADGTIKDITEARQMV